MIVSDIVVTVQSYLSANSNFKKKKKFMQYKNYCGKKIQFEQTTC